MSSSGTAANSLKVSELDTILVWWTGDSSGHRVVVRRLVRRPGSRAAAYQRGIRRGTFAADVRYACAIEAAAGRAATIIATGGSGTTGDSAIVATGGISVLAAGDGAILAPGDA